MQNGMSWRKRLAPIGWGFWRAVWPAAVAFGLVFFLRWIHIIKPNAELYTAWAVTSGLVATVVNSIFREQKRLDDVDRHELNLREIETVQKLVLLIRDDLRGGRADVGMQPVVPPKDPDAKK
jgi:hypothetical protein